MHEYLVKLSCGFYYGLLNIDEQLLYRQIGIGISRGEKHLDLKYMDSQDHRKVFTAIRYDNPEFFYWSPELSSIEGKIATLEYRIQERRDIISVLAEVRKKRSYIAELCYEKAAGSEEKLLLCIYEFLMEHVSYAYDELQKPACTKWIYDIEGSLVRGRAVCLGIAQAVNYICTYLHVPCVLVTGKAELDGHMVSHGWNLVEIDGCYRHLDVTCDLCEKSGGEYRYFLAKDTQMSGRIWKKEFYPATE